MDKKIVQPQVPSKKYQSKKGRIKPAQPPIDRFAGWLARRSRGVRLLIAGLIAVEFPGTAGLLLYGLLLTLPTGTLNVGPFTAADYLTCTLVALLILGITFYWIGWRLLVGFNWSDSVFKLGRPAALWVVSALSILLVMSCLIFLYAMAAVAPG